MAINAGPDIVEDGLVLYLDAANPRSYPGSGTGWFNLSTSNITGTLTNGPTFNQSTSGWIIFDGVNDNVTLPLSSAFNFGTGNFSIEMWVYPTSYLYDPTLLHMGNYQSSSGLLFYIASGYNKISVFENLGIPAIYFNLIPTLNNWNHIVFSKESSSMSCYLQTVAATGTLSNQVNIAPTGANAIGYDATYNNGYFTGRIAFVKIYQKALSADEVKQNFNALRGRFNL